MRQLFERYPVASPAECSTTRLEFFKKALWPRIKQTAPRGLLLLVPHYFDFVRLRNFLMEEDAEFSELCEYTDQKEVRVLVGAARCQQVACAADPNATRRTQQQLMLVQPCAGAASAAGCTTHMHSSVPHMRNVLLDCCMLEAYRSPDMACVVVPLHG